MILYDKIKIILQMLMQRAQWPNSGIHIQAYTTPTTPDVVFYTDWLEPQETGKN